MTANNTPDRNTELTPQQIRVIAVGHASEIISGAAHSSGVTGAQLIGFAKVIEEYITGEPEADTK